MSGTDLRSGTVRCLQSRFPTDPRHLRRIHRTRGASLARRSVSRREPRPFGDAGRPRNQSPHPRRNRTDRIGRNIGQQDAGQDRFGLPETRRTVHDPARTDRRVRRGPSHRAVLRHRGGDGPEDARHGNPYGRRPQAAGRSGAGPPFRQGRTQLLRLCPRHRRTRGHAEPHPQIARRGDDLRRRYRRPGTTAAGAVGRARRGLEPPDAARIQGKDRRAETQVRQFPPDNPVEDAFRSRQFGRNAQTGVRGAAGGGRFPRTEDPPDRPYGRQFARSLHRVRAAAIRFRGIRPERLNDFSHDRRQHGKGKDDNCLKRDRLWGAKPLPDHRVFSNLREISQAPRTGRTIARRRVAA